MKRSKENIIAFQTIVYQEVCRFTRVWGQTLVPPVITMTLYFIVFGQFIGSRLSDVHGVTFMQFMAPGLVIMSAIMNAYNNTCFSFFVSKFHKSIEELLVAPVPDVVILLGYVFSGVVRGVMVGAIVLVVALLFTHFHPHSVPIVLLSGVLSSTLFSMLGFTNALYAKKFDDVSTIPTFVLTPLIYLGGVFFSVSQLSPFWQKIAVFNPIMYIVATFRYGFLGVMDLSISFGFGMLVAFIIGFFMFNLYLLKRGAGIRS